MLYGQDWASIPFPRMPNVQLMQPAPRNVTRGRSHRRDDRGIFIEGDGSFSIDQQRYNFQFGGQTFWEIRDGKGRACFATSPMWRARPTSGIRCDDRRPTDLPAGPALWDAKGQPSNLNSVSHGCPVALFRNVNVINRA